MLTKTSRAFIRGILDGMAAPMTAFNPEPIHTHIDDWVTTPSYKPLSEDQKNIKQDFERAFSHVREEINAARDAHSVRR